MHNYKNAIIPSNILTVLTILSVLNKRMKLAFVSFLFLLLYAFLTYSVVRYTIAFINIFLQMSESQNSKTTSLNLDFKIINRDTKQENGYGSLMDV
jgi:hypothetical protein